jgi:hypothetical protein
VHIKQVGRSEYSGRHDSRQCSAKTKAVGQTGQSTQGGTGRETGTAQEAVMQTGSQGIQAGLNRQTRSHAGRAEQAVKQAGKAYEADNQAW